MRLGTVSHEGREKVVADLGDDRMVDLAAAAGGLGEDAAPFHDMLALIHGGENALSLARALMKDAPDSAIMAADDVAFRTPITPVQYRDCLVFETHLKNSFAQAEKMTGRPFAIPPVWYDQPIYYKGNRLSFVGHLEDVIWPGYAEFLDVELELAILVLLFILRVVCLYFSVLLAKVHPHQVY